MKQHRGHLHKTDISFYEPFYKQIMAYEHAT